MKLPGLPCLLLLVVLVMGGCKDPFVAENPRAYQSVATGGEHSCAVSESGEAYCWGRGVDGELGIGIKENRSTPTRVAGNLTFKQITAGENHSCAITTDGLGYCWGWNAYFQRGNTGDPRDSEPVPLSTNERFRSISAGAHHTCALSVDSLAFCWGFNRYGQLGDGTTTTVATPRAVNGGLRFVQLSSGAWHTCAVTAGGRVYCWGNNAFGQLGIGAGGVASGEPQLVNSPGQFVQVDGGTNHTCARASNNLLYCWGSSEFGELGDGGVYRPGLPGALVPSRVSPLLDAGLSISAGESHTCATGVTGLGFCWGRGLYGQLGIGRTSDEYQPQNLRLFAVNIPVTEFATGGSTHVCALIDRTVYCWGTGKMGQLGLGGITETLLPTRVHD